MKSNQIKWSLENAKTKCKNPGSGNVWFKKTVTIRSSVLVLWIVTVFLNQTLIQKKISKKSFQDGKLPTSPTFWELLQKQSQKKSRKVVEGGILILEISSMTYWKLLKICPNVMWFTENHLMLSIQKIINWMECPHTWAPW